jgi:hypothetical protein
LGKRAEQHPEVAKQVVWEEGREGGREGGREEGGREEAPVRRY